MRRPEPGWVDGDLKSRTLSPEKGSVDARSRKYPPELLDRGARRVFESGRPIARVARGLGVPSETLRSPVRRVEADAGVFARPSSTHTVRSEPFHR
jgi:transposase-like protein